MDNRMASQQQIKDTLSGNIIGKKYKHFKGNIYEVINLGVHSESTEIMVVYKDTNNNVWIRPYDMFTSEVDHEKYPDVKQKLRFEQID